MINSLNCTYSGQDPYRYVATPPIIDPSWEFDGPEYQAAIKDHEERASIKYQQYLADYDKMYPRGTYLPAVGDLVVPDWDIKSFDYSKLERYNLDGTLMVDT